MKRILEPELMEDAEQAKAYAKADFSASEQWFVDHLVADYPSLSGLAVDFGCGPGNVVLRLARAIPSLRITAVDGSEPMIRLAEAAVQSQNLQDQIRLLQGRLPSLALPDHRFDLVSSKDLLHHLPNPDVLWQEGKRLAKPGAVVYVMDLFRPDSVADAKSLVQEVAGGADPIVQEDFFHSLRAAFLPSEVEVQLEQAGLDLKVARVSSRHMLIHGTIC